MTRVTFDGAQTMYIESCSYINAKQGDRNVSIKTANVAEIENLIAQQCASLKSIVYFVVYRYRYMSVEIRDGRTDNVWMVFMYL